MKTFIMDSALKVEKHIIVLRTFIHMKSLKSDYLHKLGPLNFRCKRSGHFFSGRIFFGEISKPLRSKDLVVVFYSARLAFYGYSE